jgi:diaminohydroxyphosphoribosylaminopyrimidine deaminase/5-amino-6-(5-phosphoribosylamino)uracil reductase
MSETGPEKGYMKRALALAQKGRGRTSPNPMVGAVIVKNGGIVAQGWHERAGAPHAEAMALQKAEEKAKGATLYVTLEPCCHTDKRTPPCTRAIIASGVNRVVSAMADPNPKVSGKGFAELRRAGIEVVNGVLEEDARRLNEAYIKHVTTGKPFVTLKVAMSLDGKIATRTGDSKWITGGKARGLVHRVRADVDAVLTAVGTVKADDPLFTARVRGGKNPVRVVIDPGLESPVDSKIFQTPPETILVTRKKLPKMLEDKGINILSFHDKLSLDWLMEKLGERGIMSVLIEGGSGLAGYAVDEGVVDKVMFFIAPMIVGGREAFPAVGGKGIEKIKDAYNVRNLKIRRIGEDLLLEGYLG